jgi:hypothetical protein
MTVAKRTKLPRVVRGSVVVHRRKCGKPNCRCADGTALHEATVLSYSQAGKTRFVMLPADQVGAVREATARYQAAKARLEEEANAGLEELVTRLSARRSPRT